MVGSALAALLGTQNCTKNMRTLVLEASSMPQPPQDIIQNRSEPGIRVSALNFTSIDLLKQIGVWDTIKSTRATPYQHMQVWDVFSRGRVNFNVQRVDPSYEALGYVVENDILQSAIFQKLEQLDADDATGIRLCTDRSVDSLQYVHTATAMSVDDDDHRTQQGHAARSVLIELHNNKTGKKQAIRTRLVVGADGPQSIVKRELGFGQHGWEYNQKGVVATVETDCVNPAAWQRFLPNGPVALLPCHNRYSSVVWSTTPEHADHLLNLSPEAFLQDLNAAFSAPPSAFSPDGKAPWMSNILPESLRDLLPQLFVDQGPPHPETGELMKVPPKATALAGKPSRAAFPLRFRQSSAYVMPRVALVGDAAHVVHPMAGQGVNLGFGDVVELGKQLSFGRKHGLGVGDVSVLREFESERMAENQVVMHGVDFLSRFFSYQVWPCASCS
eukprot:GABV01000327.1.p1 GENE.GABV01000327.1~~GABV01000327.1.p1  ORF type:complete len:444 (+),score=149.26 GABV01000327.1:3-1334(+)